MGRALLALNLLLALGLSGLWWLDHSFESRFERGRRSVSMFLPLANSGIPTVASVARLELKLPGSETTWKYTRESDGWRLPEYRGAFARPQELDAGEALGEEAECEVDQLGGQRERLERSVRWF